jgi:hypothetical protein
MLADTLPKGVGYWGSGVGQGLAALSRPEALVRPGWQLQDRERIVAYLAAGIVCAGWCGLAVCRFAECVRLLGSCDLTDGMWIWPQGLEHYLIVHEVCLPEAFVETMRGNHWQIPAGVKGDEVLALLEEANALPFGDLSEWIHWSRELVCRG